MSYYYIECKHSRAIVPNEKIVQFSFEKKIEAEFEIVEELDDTERGSGGFGHSGRV